MKYERALKLQAKEEKVLKEQRKKERQAQEKANNGKNGNGNKRRQNSQGTASGFNTSNRSFRSGIMNKEKGKDVEINQILDISAIQLESSLSEIGTIEGLKARAGDKALEAQLSEMLAVSQNNISGLKTVTQKDLVFLAEQHWQQKEQLKKENRKVLEWSGDQDESDHKKENSSEDANKNILAGLSVDEPSSWKHSQQRHDNSVPISPSHNKIQGQVKQDQLLSVQNSKSSAYNQLQNYSVNVTSLDNQNSQQVQNNMMIQQIDGPSPIRPNPDASQPPGDSFYNDSSGIAYLESDLEQLTPQ